MISDTWATLPLHAQVAIAIVCALWLTFHLRYNEKTVAYAPTILTTTGIFATFVGIALGLSEFDPANIQASVPALLGGLKTAFWASVVGVGGALTIKFRHFFLGVPSATAGSGADGEITAADLASLLRGIHQALVGTEEATLVSQLKLMRSDVNDRLDALGRSQNEALQKLSEMGSKALVEALRDVIRDFNSKLTEQFGENFKELNAAVAALVTWQGNYKTHIETVTRAQQDAAASMKQATDDYRTLVDKAGAFTTIAKDLSTMLRQLEAQNEHLSKMLTELGSLLKAASGSLPQIEAKVIALTDQLSKGVAENQREVSKALSENVLLIRNSIQAVGQDYGKINQDFNTHLGQIAAKMREQVAVLDAALAEELKKSLESLGRQLAALSEKFVSDYGPLTDKLQRLVAAARAA